MHAPPLTIVCALRHSACAHGREPLVRTLLAAAANGGGGGDSANACNRSGVTPLMAAAANGHASIVRRLLAAGATTEPCDADGGAVCAKA